MIGSEFYSTRIRLGLSQKDLARRMDVSTSTVGVLEISDRLVPPKYEKILLSVKYSIEPSPTGPDMDALAAYNAVVNGAAALYKLAKHAKSVAAAAPVSPDSAARERVLGLSKHWTDFDLVGKRAIVNGECASLRREPSPHWRLSEFLDYYESTGLIPLPGNPDCAALFA